MTSKRDTRERAVRDLDKGDDATVPGKGGTSTSSATSTSGAVEIELLHARNHHLRWVVLGLILGGLCVTQLGTLGQWVGVVLLALAAWAAFRVVQTLRHPPGTIIVNGDRVTLPRGLCRGEPLDLTRTAVSASYLLRKAVAWHQAAPVLVVEADGKVLAYPRDWFASEADQRRVLDALVSERPEPTA